MNLLNILDEVLASIGHERDCLRGSFSCNNENGDKLMEVWVDTPNYLSYSIQIDNQNNIITINVGGLPGINCNEPDSITVLKCTLLQVPLYLTLKEVRDKFNLIF